MGKASTGRREPPHEVYTVSRLNLEVRGLIEGALPPLWIEGEISNLARPRSGHIYFSLKDEHCQVRCAMFRSANRRLEFSPENGAQVLAHVRPGLYPERGEFQLLVEYMEQAGAGALWRAFDLLKARLQAEGLFDPAARKPLPRPPRGIAVLTSATGAALRDIVSVTRRRCPQVPLLLIPIPVQGAAAAPAIVAALAAAAAREDCDVVLLARGGGSIEDLWAFNEESVARAVHACPLPVVTGIGHETDFTIADFVADCRGATPSAAAELLTPDAAAWADRRRPLDSRLGLAAREHLRRARARLRQGRRRWPCGSSCSPWGGLPAGSSSSVIRAIPSRRCARWPRSREGAFFSSEAPRKRPRPAKPRTASGTISGTSTRWHSAPSARRTAPFTGSWSAWAARVPAC